MVISASQLKTLTGIGRWQIEGCLAQTSPAIDIESEMLSIGAPDISFIDWTDATLYLNGQQARSTPAKLLNGLGVVAGLGGTVMEISAIAGQQYKPGNARIAVGLAVGSLLIQLIPGISRTFASQVPTVTALISPTKYPVLIAPGRCFTDHRYAAKMPSPKTLIVTIPR